MEFYHLFQLLLFISGMGLAFTGAAAEFKRKKGPTDEIHYIGAFLGILPPITFIIIKGIYIIPIIWGISSLLLFLFRKKCYYVWWIEILSFTLIMAGLLNYILI